MTHSEPERFITVSDMTLFVNGVEYDVGRTCSTKIDLQKPADLPLGDATLKTDVYGDDGELLFSQESAIEILHAIDVKQGAYAIRLQNRRCESDMTDQTADSLPTR